MEMITPQGKCNLVNVSDTHCYPYTWSLLPFTLPEIVQSASIGDYGTAIVTGSGAFYWMHAFRFGVVPVPELVRMTVPVRSVAVGPHHALICTIDGLVHSFGHNDYLQLG
jgi:hypothetical protein